MTDKSYIKSYIQDGLHNISIFKKSTDAKRTDINVEDLA